MAVPCVASGSLGYVNHSPVGHGVGSWRAPKITPVATNAKGLGDGFPPLPGGFQVARRPGLELIRTSYATMDGSDSSPIPLVLEALAA